MTAWPRASSPAVLHWGLPLLAGVLAAACGGREPPPNACGGTAVLDERPGERCGPCGLDFVVCAGEDGTACSGETPCPGFVVETTPPTGIDATSAVLGGRVDPLPAEAIVDHGVCWRESATPEPDGDTCVRLGALTEAGAFSTPVNLDPGRLWHVVAFARTEEETAVGQERLFRTLTPPPVAVQASDGTHPDHVEITWEAVDGAVAYLVHRGEGSAETLVGVVDARLDTRFLDLTAPDGGAPGVPPAVAATGGDRNDAVVLTWEVPDISPGPAQSYRVTALYPAGESPPSDPATGYRGASPVVAYQLEIGGAVVVEVLPSADWEDGPVHVDLDAPAGVVEPGVVEASKGTHAEHVALSLTGATANPGETVGYRVRAINAAGAGDLSDPVTGHRGVGEIVVAWETSDDGGTSWTLLDGSAGLAFEDTAAAADGTHRLYRAQVLADGATPQTTDPDHGFRRAPAVSLRLSERETQLVLFGPSVTLSAEAHDAAGNLLPVSAGDLTWTAHNPGVAEVGPTGSVSPVATGQGAITVAFEGLEDHALAIVNDPSPQPVTEWESLWLTSNRLNGIWSSGSDDVFAVGLGGTVVHYDGTGWRVLDTPVLDELSGVWGSAPDDVWAVGRWGRTLRYDGESWSQVTSGTTQWLQAVWGSGPSDVWAVGRSGTLRHYDGGGWQAATSPTTSNLEAVWGRAAGDVWAVGQNGTIVHYDGIAWESVSSPTTQNLYDVWGTDDDLWAVGWAGRVVHYDGDEWTETLSGASRLYGVWGSGSDDVWAVGLFGSIVHYDGSSWTLVESPTEVTLHHVWGNAADDVWAAGAYGVLLHFDGTAWRVVEHPPASTSHEAVWGSAADDLWVVGTTGAVIRFDGQAWNMVPTSTSSSLYSVWGSGPDDVWIGGDWALLYWDGTTLHELDTPFDSRVRGLWGSGPGHLFAVGENGSIAHFDGAAWTEMWSRTREHLYGVWGSGPEHAFAVGEDGYILYYGGSEWLPQPSPTTQDLRAVWGSAPDDVWAVGGSGTIVHFDGSDWTVVDSPTGERLWSVRGTGPTDVWAAGDSATLLHFDGTEWRAVDNPAPSRLYDIFAMTPGDLMVFGTQGEMMRGLR